MVEIVGIKYISDKEASKKYGFSISWFQRERFNKTGPRFIKLNGKGKVFYPVEETDNWFKNKMQYII